MQSGSAASGGVAAGHLTQLAAEINASPRVRSLVQLRQSIHESPRTLRQQYGSGDAIDDAAAQAKRREERFQAKPNEELRQHRDSNAASTCAAAEPASRSAGKSGLPPQLKSGVESLSGMSMDHVKVHYNSGKPAQLNALAYAQGSDIHVAPGQEKHLPHEAWHVVQQAQGRVRPTRQMKGGVPINDNKGLELEADAMGNRAMQIAASSLQLRDEPSEPPRVRLKVAGHSNASPSTAASLAIQQKALVKDKLNVAGEYHPESSKRRAQEAEYTKEKTGGEYFQEGDFKSSKWFHQPDRLGDPFLLRAEMLLAILKEKTVPQLLTPFGQDQIPPSLAELKLPIGGVW
ncbi:MAG: eCIS core domain-containing protein, partial [Terracidiphilus sp.]